MKINRRILEKKLELFLKSAGKKKGYNLGEYSLDFASVYGGYIIVEHKENGGVHHPFVNRRLSLKEMDAVLDMALALQLNRENEEDKSLAEKGKSL